VAKLGLAFSIFEMRKINSRFPARGKKGKPQTLANDLIPAYQGTAPSWQYSSDAPMRPISRRVFSPLIYLQPFSRLFLHKILPVWVPANVTRAKVKCLSAFDRVIHKACPK